MSDLMHMYEQEKELYRARRYREAVEPLTRVVKHAAANKQTEQLRHFLPLLLHCYIELEQYTDAFSEIEHYDYLYRHAESDLDQCHYKLCKGTLYMHTGEFERAEIYFQQLFQMALDEEHPLHLMKYGTYYLHLLQRSQQIDKGLSIAALIEIYVEQQPDISPHMLCSFYMDYVALIQQTQYALRSEKYVERLRLLQPKKKALLTYYEATLLFMKGHYDEAFAHYEDAFSRMQEQPYTAHVSLLQQCMKRYEQAGQFQSLCLLQKRYILMLENAPHRTTQQSAKQTVKRMNLHEIERLANEDSLTGIYNRYYLEKEAEELVLMSRLLDENCSCAVFDVDNFKTINDTYGHIAGDEALTQVVKRIQKVMEQERHLFARYGGDEFVVLLNMPQQKAQACIERALVSVSSMPIQVAQLTLPVTISIGLVHNRTAQVNTFKELFRLADDSLYYAKKNGRNQLHVHKDM